MKVIMAQLIALVLTTVVSLAASSSIAAPGDSVADTRIRRDAEEAGFKVKKSPISKVVKLLDGLKTQIEEIAQAQKVQWLKVKEEQCDKPIADTEDSIRLTTDEADQFKADIASKTAKMEELIFRMEKLTAGTLAQQKELDAGNDLLHKMKDDYYEEIEEVQHIQWVLKDAIYYLEGGWRGKSGVEASYKFKTSKRSLLQTKGVKTIEQALKVLVEASFLNTADSHRLSQFIQENQERQESKSNNSFLSAADTQKFKAFIQSTQADEGNDDDEDDDSNDDSEDSLDAPAARVYKTKSTGIMDLLHGMLDKVNAKLEAGQLEFHKEVDAQDMFMQQFRDEKKFLENKHAKCKDKHFQLSQEVNAIEINLNHTNDVLKVLQQSLDTYTHDCKGMTEDYEEGVTYRTKEIEAVSEAKRVIEESAHLGHDETEFLHMKKNGGTSFLQMKSKTTSKERSMLRAQARAKVRAKAVEMINYQVVHYLDQYAAEKKVPQLAMLASQIHAVYKMSHSQSVPFDPIARVKEMIGNEIKNIEAEAQEDADRNEECKTQLYEEEMRLNETTPEYEDLKADYEEEKANLAVIREKIAREAEEIAKVDNQLAKIAEIRDGQIAIFDKELLELKTGLKGVKMAVDVLKHFYGDEPTQHGGTVISLMQELETDFTANAVKLKAEETAQANSYTREKNALNLEKTVHDTDMQIYESQETDKEREFAECEEKFRQKEGELNGIKSTLAALKEECADKRETVQDRWAKRDAMIAGCREALRIMTEEVALMQVATHHHRRHLRGKKHAHA